MATLLTRTPPPRPPRDRLTWEFLTSASPGFVLARLPGIEIGVHSPPSPHPTPPSCTPAQPPSDSRAGALTPQEQAPPPRNNGVSFPAPSLAVREGAGEDPTQAAGS